MAFKNPWRANDLCSMCQFVAVALRHPELSECVTRLGKPSQATDARLRVFSLSGRRKDGAGGAVVFHSQPPTLENNLSTCKTLDETVEEDQLLLLGY